MVTRSLTTKRVVGGSLSMVKLSIDTGLAWSGGRKKFVSGLPVEFREHRAATSSAVAPFTKQPTEILGQSGHVTPSQWDTTY